MHILQDILFYEGICVEFERTTPQTV